MRHAHRQSGRAARPAKNALFPDLIRELVHLIHRYREIERVDLRHSHCRFAFYIHAEVHSRIQRAGGDERHDGDQRFQAHRDRARISLARDYFRSGPARDKSMEPGDGAARYRDETKRKQLARYHQTRAIDEATDGGHFQIR